MSDVQADVLTEEERKFVDYLTRSVDYGGILMSKHSSKLRALIDRLVALLQAPSSAEVEAIKKRQYKRYLPAHREMWRRYGVAAAYHDIDTLLRALDASRADAEKWHEAWKQVGLAADWALRVREAELAEARRELAALRDDSPMDDSERAKLEHG